MKRNRKKVETYRFNGYTHLHAGSIHPVTIADLESRIRAFEAKLTDPEDADDKRWTRRWLGRFETELSKKLERLDLRGEERAKAEFRRREQPSPGAPDA